MSRVDFEWRLGSIGWTLERNRDRGTLNRDGAHYMIRIPPAYLEQIPEGVVRLCDSYPQSKPQVWCILSKGGVSLRTAQAAMRHSTPTLTANVYTDPKLLDVAGALDALPSLPLGGQSLVAVNVAVGTGNRGDFESTADTLSANRKPVAAGAKARRISNVCKGGRGVAPADKELKNGRGDWIRTSDPLPPRQVGESCNDSGVSALASHPLDDYTKYYTKPASSPDTNLQALAIVLAGLSTNDRAQLIRLLLADRNDS